MRPKVVAVVDLQFGSTGKGLMAGYLSLNGYRGEHFSAAVTNWGPNAGHTTVYPDGEKIIRTMVPNSLYRGTVRTGYIGPGSAINMAALIEEADHTARINRKRFDQAIKIYVHEHAAVVRPGDADAEKRHNRIGSTQKGTAEAWAAKMGRDPADQCLAKHHADTLSQASNGVIEVIPHRIWLDYLSAEHLILAEGCQGYSLGYSSGFWPYVTARECTVAQLLADCCLSPRDLVGVVGCARTYPIRVANRFDADGNMVGTSGPGYLDQQEITFEAIGQSTEYTTVTKLPRRIFTFSKQQFYEAIHVNGVTEVFMNFMNYIADEKARAKFVIDIEDELDDIYPVRAECPKMKWFGYGAATNEVLQGGLR